MNPRVASALLWVGLVVIAVTLAPPPAPGTGALIARMLTGDLDGVNLSLFALFNVMGVLPMAFSCLLGFDEHQRLPAWPFLVASFAIGAFALLPWLALRRWGGPRRAADRWWLRVLGHRATGAVLVVLAVGLSVTFVAGDLRGFQEQLVTEQFPFVMSFDFLACWLAGALLASDEARSRAQPRLRWLGVLPVVGLPLVVALRDVGAPQGR